MSLEYLKQNDMKRILYILYIVVMAMIVSCSGCGNTKDGTAGDAGLADFEQRMRVADSLYSSMQFRDAYDLYEQLLESEEFEADSEKRLRVLGSLSNASELSGHKDMENKWLQQQMDLAKTAGLLARMGIHSSGSRQSAYFQRADSAYAAWKAVQYEGNHTRDYFIVDYMKRRGRHSEAVAIYNGLIERIRQQGDTLGEMMNTAKWGLADVCHQMGRNEQAATLYEQVLEIQDTLKTRKARNTAQELAAVYHDKEQQQTIMQQEAENTRQEAVILIIVLVLIAVAALAVIVLRKNRIIRRKNQSLAQQITEAMTYKERYLQQMAESTRSECEPTDPDKLTDEQLFQYINDVIVRERLFADPAFGRDSIMERFQLSKERVGAAFSKGSQYASLSDYTQELRLEYSTLLMSTRPEMSISQIALDCGFSSYAYYGKCFRRRFGMTPTEFRQSAEQNQLIRG